MHTFTKTITVTKDDLDELNHVNNVRYVQWVNDIAKAHWLQSASTTIVANYFWVLVSHTIQYKRAAVLNDKILIKTYVVSSNGATSTRLVEMYNKTSNRLLATSETNWCFMSSQTQKPTRITEEVKALFS
ncbi:thioesterase family protein [Lacinutrix sp. Hel_I_90]|uniref:acyl-CoA thioesterase n=1 Tax=Lacinutrix sp. Hel_I_90 TaxID=1249999 RepID=UPI0005CA66F2|nr:thioesterase family protein [Lacinutrix sp. Hel_I_90]